MKYIISLLFLTTFANFANGQEATVKIDTISNAVIVHEYIAQPRSYCKGRSFILLEGDSIPFFEHSSMNNAITRKIKGLNVPNHIIDYLQDFVNSDFTYDLTISEFNYIINPVVRSISFYTVKGSDNLYSIYQFSGTIALYSNIDIKKLLHLEKVIDEDCPCSSYMTTSNLFAVLLETKQLKPITSEQEQKMKVNKSGIESIYVTFCE